MYYVGIDIAKLNHFASVVSSDGEVLVKPFKFKNDNDGFCTLLSALASYDRGSLIIGLESMAHYADNLVEFLVSKRYQVCVINPIQTSSDRALSLQVTQSVEQIELLDRQITDVESEMTEIMLGLDSVIMIIPDIGYINAWNDPWRNRKLRRRQRNCRSLPKRPEGLC